MKIGGVEVQTSEEILVLPRSLGEDIIIRAKPVKINEEFEKRIPEPTPPNVRTKNGSKPDYSDENYKKALKIRNEQRLNFLIIKSLEPSEIEWEEVNIDTPGTWSKWSKELIEAGISEIELNRITDAVMSANSLDEEKIEEARKSFLHGQGA